jgi:sulfide:quinone oxidoreductase
MKFCGKTRTFDPDAARTVARMLPARSPRARTLAGTPRPVPLVAARRPHVLIVGGGSAGLTLAARLRRARPELALTVLDPAREHSYQPLWTLVGGGVVRKESTRRSQQSVIPDGVAWLRASATKLDPDGSSVITGAGEAVAYDVLVLCPGIKLDWAGVAGLGGDAQADATRGICSIYAYEHVDLAWQQIRAFRGGTAIFTFPSTPIKCPGAAQKIMYLADDHFRRAGVRADSRIVFVSAARRIFAVDRYARTLEGVVARKRIETLFRHELVAVRPDARQAVIRNLDDGSQTTVDYDLLHVTPPQRAPEVVERSPLASEAGWVDVDRETLQHVRYENVFSLGDASSLPTSKTGAAVRAQARVAATNLLAYLDRRTLSARYDGYAACPLVTGYGKVVLAEFDYDGKPRETFPFDQSKERWSMYQLKRHGLPRLYWNGMLRGRA